MAKTNEPIILNSTGRRILDSMKMENALLAMLVEENRPDVYSDILQVANIVRSGYGADIFPIGDQFIIPWKDMDDPAHNTDGTAWPIAHNVVAHGDVVLETGEIVPGMFLQWHLCSPYDIQFSRQQAFYKCMIELVAGTYYITFGGTWGSTGATSGSIYNFTLTQNVPAGGFLSGFEGLPDQAQVNWRVKSWASAVSATPIETVLTVAGAAGTSLGTMPYTIPGTLNCMQKVAYGDNRWGTSGIRQYLNTAGSNWFSQKGTFDLRPDQYAKTGFLSGYKYDFLSAIKPVKVTTALNTVEGYSTQTEETYDKFFLPSLEQMNITPQLASAEGPRFPYWQRRMGLPGFGLQGGTYSRLKTAPINNPASPRGVRLRSANRGTAGYPWSVYSSGHVSSYSGASNAFRCSPVCVIC